MLLFLHTLLVISFFLLLIILIMYILVTSLGRVVTLSMLNLAWLPALRPLIPFQMTFRHHQGGFQVRNLPVILTISFILGNFMEDTLLLVYFLGCSFTFLACSCLAYLEKF